MSTLVKELEGRSWNWTRQLPILLRLVNRHSAIFLFILLVGWFMNFLAYFFYSDLNPVGGLLVFYVSRVLFGFYMNGVLFCMPVLFSLEAHLVSARIQAFTEAIGKFPNLDSAIEEHIEIWKCVDRLSRLWGPVIAITAVGTGVCAMTNIHYLLGRHSQYFLLNILMPGFALFIFLNSASKITARAKYTAVHLSGYRSSADIFLAPLERIDFLTYLQANDPGFRVLGVLVTAGRPADYGGVHAALHIPLHAAVRLPRGAGGAARGAGERRYDQPDRQPGQRWGDDTLMRYPDAIPGAVHPRPPLLGQIWNEGNTCTKLLLGCAAQSVGGRLVFYYRMTTRTRGPTSARNRS
jgi:hypothetical protein